MTTFTVLDELAVVAPAVKLSLSCQSKLQTTDNSPLAEPFAIMLVFVTMKAHDRKKKGLHSC